MTPATASSTKRLAALLVFMALPLFLAMMAGFNAWSIAATNARASASEIQMRRLTLRNPSQGVEDAAPQDYAAVFVEAPSRSLAEVELQRRVIAIIERVSARVIESRSVDLRVDSDDDNAIAVRATLDTTNDGLLRLLHSVETGVPLLFVEELAIRQLQTDASDSGRDPPLRVEIRIRGHWKETST